MLIFLKTYKKEVFCFYLDWTISFDTSLILGGILLDFRFKRQSFRVYRGRARFQVFLLKKYVLVFLLDSLKARILDLLVVNSFISWFHFLFYLEFKFKEKSFRVYRGQWDILIILPKTSVSSGFHCWYSTRVRYLMLRAPRDLIARCIFKCQLFFQIWNELFFVYRVLWNIRGPALETVFCVLILLKTY